MADNINLIPAAELPLTEADEIDVLCVEGGELKRKAASNLGGSGSYIIHVPASEVVENEASNMYMVRLSESYDNFAPIIAAGGTVYLDMSEYFADELRFAYFTVLSAVYDPGQGGFIVASMDMLSGKAVAVVAANGTWTPEA